MRSDARRARPSAYGVAMQTPGGLDAGRHDAVVVDARWDPGSDPPVLELSLTLLAGRVKGEVVEIGFVAGSPGRPAGAR